MLNLPVSDDTQAAQEQLKLKPSSTIVIDIGHCAGKFCMYASLLGFRSVGIEAVKARWAVSVNLLWNLLSDKVLGDSPSVSLLHLDAEKLMNFVLASAPDMDVLVYCWNRGLKDRVFQHVQQAAARTPQVKGALRKVWDSACFFLYLLVCCVGIITETEVMHPCFEKVATVSGCKADKNTFSTLIWKRRVGVCGEDESDFLKMPNPSFVSYDTTTEFVNEHATEAYDYLINMQVCIYMYVCMYVRMRVYACLLLCCVYIHVRRYVCMQLCMYIRMYMSHKLCFSLFFPPLSLLLRVSTAGRANVRT